MTFHSTAGCSRGVFLRGFLTVGGAALASWYALLKTKQSWEPMAVEDAVCVLVQVFVAWRAFLDQSLSRDPTQTTTSLHSLGDSR